MLRPFWAVLRSVFLPKMKQNLVSFENPRDKITINNLYVWSILV